MTACLNHSKLPCFKVKPGLADSCMTRLAADREIWGSSLSRDGLRRLQKLARPDEELDPGLPIVPFKKLLLPANEPLWSWDGSGFRQPDLPPRRIVLGAALCDLQALWYLDQVFAEDPLYLRRRQRLLVVGGFCRIEETCRCQSAALPPGGDLFRVDDRFWVLSRQGETVLNELKNDLARMVDTPLPWPEHGTVPRTGCDENQFRQAGASPAWKKIAATCLSCGACSVVCPTCYCYDMVDEVAADGKVVRRRSWDNCFFADHGQVAGGGNFRPDRASRLRFRFEHKMLGFGNLRGRPSCVGCGRCLPACPTGIDLDEIADLLMAESES